MTDFDTPQLIACSLGGVALVMVAAGPRLVGRLFGGGRAPSQEHIPGSEMYPLTCGEAMTAVKRVLTTEIFVGCRFTITYDRMDEGRIQARLYGRPGDVEVDVLLNMLFHRHEARRTEVEWSYVVMSRETESSARVISETNSAFRKALSTFVAQQS